MTRCLVQLGCTDRGQHEWTVLREFTFDSQVPPGEAAKWAPAVARQPLTLFCSPCGRHGRREYRLGRARGGRLLAELEWIARTEGHASFDLSRGPF
jgi:hypothetical protein